MNKKKDTSVLYIEVFGRWLSGFVVAAFNFTCELTDLGADGVGVLCNLISRVTDETPHRENGEKGDTEYGKENTLDRFNLHV